MPSFWGTFPEWMTVFMTLGAVVVAYSGVEAWKFQLRGTSTHSTAMEIAAAVGSLHVEFFNQRAPLIETWEMETGNPKHDADAEKWQQYATALNSRYRDLNKQIIVVHNLKGKALSILGTEVADALEKLTRKASEIHQVWNTYCQLIKSGENVDPQQLHQASRLAFAHPNNRTDRLSVEFEERFRSVLRELEPFLSVK